MLAVDLPRLVAMPRAELDQLYRETPSGPIPTGRGTGGLLLGGNPNINRVLAGYTRLALWQGKVFDPERGELRNLITPFGVEAIAAKVFVGSSWSDGKPCVVLDYAETSRVARWVRDEIRLVAPHLYLGVAYLGSVRIVHFALRFGDV
jgi:hypothetical protein